MQPIKEVDAGDIENTTNAAVRTCFRKTLAATGNMKAVRRTLYASAHQPHNMLLSIRLAFHRLKVSDDLVQPHKLSVQRLLIVQLAR